MNVHAFPGQVTASLFCFCFFFFNKSLSLDGLTEVCLPIVLKLLGVVGGSNQAKTTGAF
jgi:hypothetical protein